MSNVISTIIWVGFLSGVLYFFRRDLRGLLDALLGRLRQGASVKFGSIEVGAVNALPSAMEKTEQARVWRSDDDGRRQAERSAYYEQTRRVMLVHKLFPATEPGELYDILTTSFPPRTVPWRQFNGSITSLAVTVGRIVFSPHQIGAGGSQS